MGTYTTNYNLFLPSIGEQGWGTLVNGNFETIDATMKGLETRTVTLETEMDAVEERVTVLETGEFESVTADVGNFNKIILNGRLSYNGYYSTGTYGSIGATNTFHTVPIISSIILLNGVVSLKTSSTGSACNLYIVSSEGITSHTLTTTQTEYTVTNGLTIYVVMKPNGGTTLTIGCPVIE